MRPDQDILAAYQVWATAYDTLARTETEAEADVAFEALRVAEAEVLSLIPATARDLAIQITVFTSFYEFDLEASNTFDMEAFVEKIADVKRPATFPTADGRAAA